MVFKRLFIGCFIMLISNLYAFQHSTSLMKKVHKEIVASFDVSQYEMGEVTVSDEINAKLKKRITANHLFKIRQNTKVIGFAYIDKAPSKTDDFDFLILLDTQFIIKKAKVLIYREDYGGEIGSTRWLKQFVGKSSKDPLNYSQNIIAISGATISAYSMTKAIQTFLQDIMIIHQEKGI